MENNNEKIRYEIAAEKVRKIKKFYTSVAVFLVAFGLVYGFRILKYGFPPFGYGFRVSMIFVIWALILAIKGIKLFLFNSDWENDMINQEMKKQNNGNL